MTNEIDVTVDIDDDFDLDDFYIDDIQCETFKSEEENADEFATEEYCKSKCKYFNTCSANVDVCLKKVFKDVLESLTPREENVIKLSFGYNNNCVSLEEIGKEYNLTKERIRQIQAKAIRKLRHPVRSKKLQPFLYDIFSIKNNNFYTRLMTELFGLDKTKLLEFNLGIDFALVNKEKSSHKSATQIQEELERNIREMPELNPYLQYVADETIVTFNQLLKVPANKINLNDFNNDKMLFDFINTIENLGYHFKFFDPYLIIQEKLSKKLKDAIVDEDIYNEQLLDLTLGTSLKLCEYRIANLGDLLRKIDTLKSNHTLSFSMQQELDEFLQSKNLALKIGNVKILYLSKQNSNELINQFAIWMMKNNHSINEFLLELKVNNINTFAIVEYIHQKFPDFIDGINLKLSSRLIDELDFSVRTMNCLIRAGIYTIEDLVSLYGEDLGRRIHPLGRKSLEEICKKLSAEELIDISNLNSEYEDKNQD